MNSKHIDLPDHMSEVDVRFCDGIYLKATHFRSAGMVALQHAHVYAHLSYIASGAVRLTADGVVVGEYVAPASIVIPAGVKHMFETLVPNTVVLCIHNADHADPDGDPAVIMED